jgi:hypothetical protein
VLIHEVSTGVDARHKPFRDTRDRMARMGHDSMHAAIISQLATGGLTVLVNALDDQQPAGSRDEDPDQGLADGLVPGVRIVGPSFVDEMHVRGLYSEGDLRQIRMCNNTFRVWREVLQIDWS